MKDLICAVGAFITAVAVLTMALMGVVMLIDRDLLIRELQQRGLKEYDRATGRLIWTEKAGGEKGGAE